MRRANLTHAFALARLEAAAARAHAELRVLWRIEPMRPHVPQARQALATWNDRELEQAARAVVRAAAGHERAVRLLTARAASDLVSAARTIAAHRRFLQRLDIAPF